MMHVNLGQCSTSTNVSERVDLEPCGISNESNEVEETLDLEINSSERMMILDLNGTSNLKECSVTPRVSEEHIPVIGTQYNSYDDAYASYNLYAKFGGFSIRKHTTKKDKGKLCFGLFVCSKEGFKKSKSDEKTYKVESRCGCKARLIIRLCPQIQKWIVKLHHMQHNHVLHSPSKMNMHRSSKGLDDAHKELVSLWHKSGLKTSQIMDVMSYAACGIQNVPFDETDVYAYLRRDKESYFGKDCQFALRFFQEKCYDNTNFYYAIQTNEKKEVINCFWVDAIGREDYYYFGDVVSFDTTYKKNCYLMLFAPFTGINHHNQSIIFGCALLGDEKKDSFVWLFKEWLKAMNNKAPKAIITDQDVAMKAAIAEVFPKTVHRCCKWHIQQNIMKHANNLFRLYSNFNTKFYAWFYLSKNKNEFEHRWKEMNIMFPEMVENKWLNDLWKDRVSWASHYSPNTFVAGMSTTQRSESMNRMFKKWVNASTPLHLFVERFEEAINRRRLKEKKYDFNMTNTTKSCSCSIPLALFIRDTFTPSIFDKFEDEFRKLMRCHVVHEASDHGTKIYKVIEYEELGNEKEYKLTYIESTQEVSNCDCYLWSFSGIVCCHMLEVFKVERVHRLPDRYILKRWTREAKSGSTNPFGLVRSAFQEDTSILHKRHAFSSIFNDCLNASLRYEETYNVAIEDLSMLSTKLKNMNVQLNKEKEESNQSAKDIHPSNDIVIRSMNSIASDNDIVLHDREPVRAKGCGKRIESGINANKPTRNCKTCLRSGHDSRICPLNLKESTIAAKMVMEKPIRKCKACNGTGHDKRNCKKIRG